jgi:hypothetical protein
MHRRIAAILAIFLLSFILTGCDSFFWKTYQNKEYGFSFLFPRGWEEEENTEPGTMPVFSAYSPLKGPNDKVKENVIVSVSEVSREMSLAAYFDLNKEAITENVFGYKHNFMESDIFAGRVRGMALVFDNTLGDVTLRTISACWKKGSRVYALSCTCQAKEYSKYGPIFRRILSSLRLY